MLSLMLSIWKCVIPIFRLLFANAYTRHASIPSLEMLAFVIGLSELHSLILKHSISLLPESMVRVDFKIDSECTLHSLNVNKLSKSILIKNAKDKMICHLAQITKGYNIVAHIGFGRFGNKVLRMANF